MAKRWFITGPEGDTDVTPIVTAFVKSLEVAGIALGIVATHLMEQDWFMRWLEAQAEK